MKTSPADWFLIRQILSNLAADQRENEKAGVSSGPLNAEKLENFISDMDQMAGG